jgi:hypothetical protein
MGMYDYLHISTDSLPVTDEEKKLIGDNPGWQTKDLDCTLTEAKITETGELQIRRFTTRWDNTKKNALGFNGILVEENTRIETVPIHGFISFYSDIGETWYEFRAKFTDGKMVELIGGKQRDAFSFNPADYTGNDKG